MARPTMSRVLYTQQLGGGMHIADSKDHLMVFDFVDNANQYNALFPAPPVQTQGVSGRGLGRGQERTTRG